MVIKPIARLAVLAVLALSGCLYLGVGSEARELQRLTDAADLIVIGDLATDQGHEGGSLLSGILSGRQLLWGDQTNFLLREMRPELSYKVAWPAAEAPLGATRGLWFIAKMGSGTQMIIGYSEESGRVAVEHRLVDQMVLARSLGESQSGGLSVALMIRNAHPIDIQVPHFRTIEGSLLIHPAVEIALWGGGLSEPVQLAPISGKIGVTEDSDWTALLSGEEQKVIIDLIQIWGVAAIGAERLTFEVEQFGDYELWLIE